jgi:hypothetical protein
MWEEITQTLKMHSWDPIKKKKDTPMPGIMKQVKSGVAREKATLLWLPGGQVWAGVAK